LEGSKIGGGGGKEGGGHLYYVSFSKAEKDDKTVSRYTECMHSLWCLDSLLLSLSPSLCLPFQDFSGLVPPQLFLLLLRAGCYLPGFSSSTTALMLH